MVRNQFHKGIKLVRSDNGSEFTSGPMQTFYGEHGILQESSCVDTPQQNGSVERKYRHILNVARALRFQTNLPIQFWGECVVIAAYLINRTPSKLLKGRSPYEILFHGKPSYSDIRFFSTLCFARSNPTVKDKFASRSKRCIFLGYPFGKKGWTVYDLETRETFSSREVKFCEDKYPFKEVTTNHEGQRNRGPDWTHLNVFDDSGPNTPSKNQASENIGTRQHEGFRPHGSVDNLKSSPPQWSGEHEDRGSCALGQDELWGNRLG